MNAFSSIFERGPKCDVSSAKGAFPVHSYKAKRINETCLSAERSRERKTERKRGEGGSKVDSIVVFFYPENSFVDLGLSCC